MIYENAQFVHGDLLIKQKNRLNRNNFQSLDTEWEVAVLNAFGKLGIVQHEPQLGGSTTPDVFFTSPYDDSLTFVADVRCVSDDGFEKNTPVKAFEIELQERIRKAGIPGGFHVSLGMRMANGRSFVALPKRGEFHKRIFNYAFKRFLNQVAANLEGPRTFEINDEQVEIKLAYDPARRGYFGSNFPLYNLVRSKDNNPVFNALKEKVPQLKKTGYHGIKGVILCNGGTDMFSNTPHSGWQKFYTAEEAAWDFLRQYSSIDFVMLLSAEWTKKRTSFDEGSWRHIETSLLLSDFNERVIPGPILEALINLKSQFPEPENTSSGARETIRNGFDPTEFQPLTGGMVDGKHISVSANGVLALLAGYITPEQFWEKLGQKPPIPGEEPNNMFARRIQNHERIARITITDRASDDSDLVFEFEHDPGTSPFRVPPEKA
jgi:hypothetical protein